MEENRTAQQQIAESTTRPLSDHQRKARRRERIRKRRRQRELLFLMALALVMVILSAGYWFWRHRQLSLSSPSPQPTEPPVLTVTPDANAQLVDEWQTTYRVMAHALGGIDGKDYTNSLEAFMVNYAGGTRLFEIDLEITTDGKIALTHTWEDFSAMTGLENRALSSEEFKSARIEGKYTPVLLEDLLQLMETYRDFYVIVDSKRFDVEGTRMIYDLLLQEIDAVDPQLAHRFIPQAYNPDIYDTLDQEYDRFDDIIFTLYSYYVESDGQKIYQFVQDRHVPVVVMHMDNDWAEKVITDILAYAKQQQREDEFTIYIHTVNDMDKALNIIEEQGFFGVYSDFITEQQLQQALAG